MRRRPITALLAAVLAAAAALAAAPAASAADTGDVYVVQGLPGTYDVVVDGETVRAGAGPKTIVGPLPLEAGSHVVRVVDGTDVAAELSVQVRSGGSVDVVAHRRSDAAQEPVLTAFANDTSPVGPGKLRLAVAHTAAAPPADIRVDGDVLFSNVANAEALTVVVPAKTYSVDIVPAATGGEPILGPVDLPLEAGTLTRVFAIGDVASRSMDAVVQTVPVRTSGAGVPGSVRTGTGGQAATEFTRDDTALYGGLAAALVVLCGVAVARTVGQARRDR